MSQFTGYVIVETQRAFMFQDHFWHIPEWVPKSQTTVINGHADAEITIKLAGWLVKKNGWKEFTEIKEPKDDKTD